MITELQQILATVLYKHNETKPTHQNHPCTIWAGVNRSNFKYARKLGLELCKEYTHRYGKIHSGEAILANMKCPSSLPKGKLTEFAQAMTEKYRDKDVVKAYRAYYLGEKLCQKGWRWEYKNRNKPEWAEEK